MTAANPLSRFVWHDLMSTDIEATTNFYSAIFPEWSITTLPLDGGVEYHMISTPNGEVGGMLHLDASLGFPSHWIAYIAVENCDAAVSRVEQLGGACVLPAMEIPSIGRMAIVHDAQGAHFKLFQMEFPRTPPEHPANGQICWNELLTTDIAGSRSFYAELLGWESAEVDMPGLGPYTLFKLNGADCARAISLPPESEAPSNWLPYLTVDNTDARSTIATQQGGVTHVEPTDIAGIGRFSVHSDPTGAAFAILQPAAT